MKFRYYIPTEDGEVFGTNDEKIARQASDSEIVLDAQAGILFNFLGDGDDEAVTEWIPPEDGLDDEDEDEDEVI